jgi:hypothetical protein
VAAEDIEPSVTDADDRLRLDGIFRSTALEGAFRQHQLTADTRVFGACLLVPVFGNILATYADLGLFGTTRQFYLLLTVRLAVLAAGLALWQAVRRYRTPAALDRLVFVACLLGGAMSIYVNTTRPHGNFDQAILFVMLIGLAYAIVPLPLLQKTLFVASTSAAHIVLMRASSTSGEFADAKVFAVAFAVANALGIVTSRQLNLSRRSAFVSMLRERQMRTRLEQALAEVRTLRGYLSICAWCKRVRDEEDAWQTVEAFVQDHTHAQFTHGVCPQCLETLLATLPEAAQRHSSTAG